MSSEKTQNMVKVLLLKVVTVINHNTKGVLQTLNSCLRFETKAFHQQGQSVNSCSGARFPPSFRRRACVKTLHRWCQKVDEEFFFFLFCFCTTYSFFLLELIWRCCIEEGEVSKKHGVENVSFSGVSVSRCGGGESLDRLAGIPTWSAQPVCWVGVCVCARVRGGGPRSAIRAESSTNPGGSDLDPGCQRGDLEEGQEAVFYPNRKAAFHRHLSLKVLNKV